MKKTLSMVFPVFIFLPVLLYVHQKVQIYVGGYQLSNNYRQHIKLVDQRDYLMHSYAQEVSLPKINDWASFKKFTPIDKKKMVALNIRKGPELSISRVALAINRFFKISGSASTVLAKDKKY